jgi:hypothetical protein
LDWKVNFGSSPTLGVGQNPVKIGLVA